MRVVRCEGQVVWTAFRDPASGRWVGVCEPLKLATEAETWAELQAESYDALLLLLRDLMETGELEAFLKEHGWRCEGPLPLDVPASEVVFDLPAPILFSPAPASRAGACV
jgi:hypothetical protein